MKRIKLVNGYEIQVEERQFTLVKDIEYQSLDKKTNTMITKVRVEDYGYFGTIDVLLKHFIRIITNERYEDGGTLREYLATFKKTTEEMEQLFKEVFK